MHFWVDFYLLKQLDVSQRSEVVTGQYRLKIDNLARAIIERHLQNVRAFDFKRRNSIEGMIRGRHQLIHLSGSTCNIISSVLADLPALRPTRHRDASPLSVGALSQGHGERGGPAPNFGVF